MKSIIELDNDVSHRDFLLISAVDDDRSCDYCRKNNGKLIRIDDQFKFIKLCPPYAIGCRTSFIAFTKEHFISDGLDLNDQRNFVTEEPPLQCNRLPTSPKKPMKSMSLAKSHIAEFIDNFGLVGNA